MADRMSFGLYDLLDLLDLDTARRYADVGVHRLIIELEGIDDGAVDGVIAAVGDTLVGRV